MSLKDARSCLVGVRVCRQVVSVLVECLKLDELPSWRQRWSVAVEKLVEGLAVGVLRSFAEQE